MFFVYSQVMVFVHSRNGTLKTATALRDLAASKGELPLFQPEQNPKLGLAQKQVNTWSLVVLSIVMAT